MLKLGNKPVHLAPILWRGSSLALIVSLLFFSVAVAASGALDLTFSGDGKANIDVNVAHPHSIDRAYGMAIQSNSRIVLVGESTDGGARSDIAIVRLNGNGTLDPSFSGDGKLITDLGARESARGVALQSDGKIVVVGDKCPATGPCNFVILRYNSNGTPDPTFNGTGFKVVSYGNGTSSSGGVAIQTDGKIVAGAGYNNGSDNDFSIYRFKTNGALDPTFSGDGKQGVGFGPGIDDVGGWGSDVALQTDGKIVMSGASGPDFALFRLNTNGSLDSTFSGDGKLKTDFGSASDFSWALTIQSDGKIVAVGATNVTGANSVMAVARYRSNGTLDPTFNGTGKKTIDFIGSNSESARSVVVQSNGKIVLAGGALGNTTGTNFAVARLNPGGGLDNTFSSDGRAMFDFNGGFDLARPMALDAGGRYVLAGVMNTAVSPDFGILRVLP